MSASDRRKPDLPPLDLGPDGLPRKGWGALRLLAAGNDLRNEGRYTDALGFYESALGLFRPLVHSYGRDDLAESLGQTLLNAGAGMILVGVRQSVPAPTAGGAGTATGSVMGIYDRDYYRSGPSFLGRLAEQGKVTLWLVGLNVVCFLLQAIATPQGSRSSPVTDWMLLDIDALMSGQVWRLLSYAFAHGGIWHLAGNMLFLWWFGRQVEDQVGSREFLIFYLLSAVVAALAYVGVEMAYSKTFHPMLGASGAVMAVLVVAACYHPRQVIYLFFVIPVPIWLFVVGYALHDLLGLVGRNNNGVALAAHLGGAAFGFAYYRFSWRLAGMFRWLRMPGRSRPRLRLYREDEGEPLRAAPRPVPAGARQDDEHLEAQVDDILAKVSRVGMEGLSDQERQVLVRASEAIKRRRG